MTTITVDRSSTATSSNEDVSNDDAASRPTPSTAAGRIAGIDIARGLALLGMFAVHVTIFGVDGESPGPTASKILAAPSGQASVLFFILSGLSLSLIADRGSASAQPGILRRRGAVLVMVGLLLTATAWGASILEHYGVMFLLAPWMLRRSNRALSILAAAGLTIGPALLLVGAGRQSFLEPLQGALGWIGRTVLNLGLDGTYPLVVWVGFFLLGIRLGRLDLTSRRVALGLLIGGGAIALAIGSISSARSDADVSDGEEVAATTTPDAETKLFDKFSRGELTEDELDVKLDDIYKAEGVYDVERDPRTLTDTSPHSGRIGWTLRSSATAIAIIGGALLLPRLFQRILWPLAALGSISLTAYLLHIVLVTDGWGILVGDEPTLDINSQLTVLVGLQTLLVVVAMLIRWRWHTGPAEFGLKALTQGRPHTR